LFDGIDFDYYLTRQRFEGACSKLYQQALEPIESLLKRNNLTENQIDQVILSGGATKMCKLQSLVKQKFSDSKLLCNQAPDEIISIGCAKQCALIKASKVQKAITKDDMIFKCISNPIYIKVSIFFGSREIFKNKVCFKNYKSLKVGQNEENLILFNAKTPLPLKKSIDLVFNLEQPFISVFENDDNIIAKVKKKKRIKLFELNI
jgi:molecular chaperone DnaK (HSP70)